MPTDKKAADEADAVIRGAARRRDVEPREGETVDQAIRRAAGHAPEEENK
jgi:hypothetical protein